MMQIDRLTWANCFADVEATGNARVVRSFLNGVVTPAIDSLQAQVDASLQSEDLTAAFVHADAQELLRASIEAFCLSIQSIWERQLRRYLEGCLRDMRGGAGASQVEAASWDGLVRIFKDVRGIPLSSFDSYPNLYLLQLLGNACRHGDGSSTKRLFELAPALWDQHEVSPPPPGTTAVDLEGGRRSFQRVELPRAWLDVAVDSIDWFWADLELIYIQSIRSRHPSAEDTIARLRSARGRRILRSLPSQLAR